MDPCLEPVRCDLQWCCVREGCQQVPERRLVRAPRRPLDCLPSPVQVHRYDFREWLLLPRKPEQEITSVAVWRELLQVTAQLQTTFVVYVNRVGVEDGITFGGGSFVVDPFGRAVASMPPLDSGVLTADLEGEVLRRARTAYPLLRDADLELVRRELDRLRRLRHDLPETAADAEEEAEARLP